MAQLEDLEFRITAETTMLRGQLAGAERQIAGFAGTAERNFASLGNRFTLVAGKMRALLGLFGVGFGVRAFSRWISDATQIEKLTDSQIQKLAGVRDAMGQVQEASDNLAQAVATRLGPMLEKSAMFWTNVVNATANLVDPDRAAQVANIQEQILAKAQAVFDLQGGRTAPARGTTAENVARLRGEIALLVEDMKKLQALRPEETLAQITDPRLRDIDVTAKRIIDPSIARGITLTREYRTELEKNLDLWHEAESLLRLGRITPGTLDRIGQDLLQPIKVDAKRMDDPAVASRMRELAAATEAAREKQEALGIAIAASFESRGMEALMSGDIRKGLRGFAQDLAELVIRITVLQPLAEQLAATFAAMKGGGGGGGKKGLFASLASLFRGGGGGGGGDPLAGIEVFGSGGHMSAGQVGIVGDRGPELWVPDMAGRVIANGAGGATVHQTFNVQAGLPPQWEVQLAGATRVAAAAAYNAVNDRLGGRR